MNAIKLETYLWLGQSWTSNSQQWLFFTTDFGKLIHHLSNLNLPVAPPLTPPMQDLTTIATDRRTDFTFRSKLISFLFSLST